MDGVNAPGAPTEAQWLHLASWRRRVSELYAAVRRADPADGASVITRFRFDRDEMFRSHPESALTVVERGAFRGLQYYPYDPVWRLQGLVTYEVERTTFDVELGRDGILRYTRIGTVAFRFAGATHQLVVYWIEGYGGGLFLPFRDSTCGTTTYAGGRYLLDTIKGADLGSDGDRLVLDFNYAYNPSCAYNPRWVCPLAPDENTLGLAVEAGEKTY
jgi:uncharacterized protein